jgi:hypothetical protein
MGLGRRTRESGGGERGGWGAERSAVPCALWQGLPELDRAVQLVLAHFRRHGGMRSP